MALFAIAGLALSVGGTVSGAMGQRQSTRAQYEQAKINQDWSEFEKQMSLTQQRGAMGLQEFDRLFGNAMLEKESLEQQVYGQRAYRDQQQYQLNQMVRSARQTQAKQTSTMASRGAGRGGTAEAIQRQAQNDLNNDWARMRVNEEQQLKMFANQRNQMLKQRNMRPSNQPPTYIPATPVQSPNTNGMMAGALMGALGQGLGGMAGMFAAGQNAAAGTPNAYGGVNTRNGVGGSLNVTTSSGSSYSTNPNVPAAVSNVRGISFGGVS